MSNMDAVARSQLTFQMLTLLLKNMVSFLQKRISEELPHNLDVSSYIRNETIAKFSMSVQELYIIKQ